MPKTLEPVLTADGRCVEVRYLTPADGELLIDLVQRLSPQSRYQRFHVPKEPVSAEELRPRLPLFLDVDGVDSVALVAVVQEEDGEAAIGVARFRRQPCQDEAEAAVVVRDDWQGQGIGTSLLRQLSSQASALGIQRFCAYVQPSNQGVHRLLKGSGMRTETRFERGEEAVVIHLTEDSEV